MKGCWVDISSEIIGFLGTFQPSQLAGIPVYSIDGLVYGLVEA